MKRIDFEYHYYLPESLEAMAKRNVDYPYYQPDGDIMYWTPTIKEPQEGQMVGLLRRGDERIKHMDENGIDAAVLSSAPGVDEQGEASIEICRQINDDMYKASQDYPGRIFGSAMLPMHDAKAACDELTRCVEELGFAGWHAHSCMFNTGLDDDRFKPIFKKAEELGAYVYLHPHCSYWNRMNDFDFNLAGSGFGFTVETQATIVRMLLKGYFDEMPNLKILLGHLAEGFPFYIDRLQSRLHNHTNDDVKMEKDVKHYFKNNIIATTSGNTNRGAFLLTKEMMGIDNMLIGSDTPFESGKHMMDFLDSIEMTVEEREKLYYKNAEKLLKTTF